MEAIGEILDRALQGINTPIPTNFAKCRERDEAERAKFLVPRWDGEQYVEMCCLTCHDLGWMVYQQNQSLSCPDCDGRQFDRTASMLRYSGIPDVQKSQRFASFKIREGNQQALAAVKLLTDDPQMDTAEVFMVLIYGNCGSGKTHLAHASGLEAIEKGIPAKFIRCGQLLREFKGAKSRAQEDYDNLFKYYSEYLYLILDDLDWGTDADVRMIEDLICERESNHLLTLISTNRNLGELQDALPRSYSRLQDKRFARCIWNKAADYRKTKAK